MPAQPTSPDQPAAARRRSRQTSREPSAELPPAPPGGTAAPEAQPQATDDQDIAGELSFREAQTALELSLAELQAPDLDVEEMAGLYRRASRYAERCEELLQRVEQEVMQWDPGQPEDSPLPYQP